MPDQYPPYDGEAPRSIPFVTRILFAIAMVFAVVGFAESGFIVYDLLSGGTLSSQRAPDLSFGIRSWTEHHTLRPGYSAPRTHTNSFGLRSPEVAVPKPAGTFRILLLGDSMTFGLRAADDDVFARRLERLLRKAGGTSPIEVINAGILSYCPLLEYLQYRNHLHILEPDLVVLNFDMSDVQDNMEYSRAAVYASDGTPLFVTEPSLGKSASAMPELLSFQWLARKYRAATRRMQARMEGSPFARDLDRFVWALDNGPELDTEVQKTFAPIADLSRLLRHHGIPFILATYPHPWQVAAEATPLPPIREQYGIGMHTVHKNDRSFRKLERFATEHEIPFLNATPVFRQDADPVSLYLANDLHFTARGHELYAEVLARYITDKILTRQSQ
jgi:lysophospholipase L1-like esterase